MNVIKLRILKPVWVRAASISERLHWYRRQLYCSTEASNSLGTFLSLNQKMCMMVFKSRLAIISFIPNRSLEKVSYHFLMTDLGLIHIFAAEGVI